MTQDVENFRDNLKPTHIYFMLSKHIGKFSPKLVDPIIFILKNSLGSYLKIDLVCNFK